MKFFENLLLLYWFCDIFTIGLNGLTQWKHFCDIAYTCKLCEDNYESLRGLRIHQSSCKKPFIWNNNVITKSLTDSCEKVSYTQIETTDVLVPDEFFIEQIL